MKNVSFILWEKLNGLFGQPNISRNNSLTLYTLSLKVWGNSSKDYALGLSVFNSPRQPGTSTLNTTKDDSEI